jgi:hypothetical protein
MDLELRLVFAKSAPHVENAMAGENDSNPCQSGGSTGAWSNTITKYAKNR